jgi:predicted N-acetyltransferase YhbS
MNEAIRPAGERSKAGNRATLRPEKKSDYNTVEQITYRAFLSAEHASGGEALLVRKLRDCAAFEPELDYVAELEGTVAGSIMYMRNKVIGDDGEWRLLTLGPVSVLPKYQRGGVGSALIRKALDLARALGYGAVLVFSHESYYPRFGLKPASEYGITTVDGENFPVFMALPLTGDALDGVRGRLICDEAYTALDKDESERAFADCGRRQLHFDQDVKERKREC